VERSRRSEHRLVILRRAPGGDVDVLALATGDGWALPQVESEERRAADVSELNREVREWLGLEVSVLCCLADDPGDGARPRRQLYVLEVHASVPGMAVPGQWVARGALGTRIAVDSGVQRFLDACPHLQAAGAPPRATPEPHGAPRRAAPDWTTPGWRAAALAWVGGELSRRNSPPVLAVEQIRVWEFSHVLRLETPGSALYLKARPADGAAEAPLTARLARRHSVWAPDVIAVERERRWLLMRETPGPSLMKVSDPRAWEQAAAAIADMQIDWHAAAGELETLGCPRLTLGQLEADIEPLLADRVALQPGRAAASPDGENAGCGDDMVLGAGVAGGGAAGLTDEEVAALRRRRPELEALCRELAAAGVPESLEHGDLWGENAIVGPRGVVFIDWEDATVAHPFFTPSLLLRSLDYTDALAHVPDAGRRIRDAYLGRWKERGPLANWPAARLERAFELAQEVAMLHYARQFWRLALPLIETSWEVRAFPPLFLRRLVR